MDRTRLSDSDPADGGSGQTASGHRCSVACPGIFDDYSFALCLTHDVDRVYKTYQTLYDALSERQPRHLKTLVSGSEPYWQFADIMAIEDEFDVRSSFYFLNEKRLFLEKSAIAALRPRNWIRYTGHYDINDPDVVDVIQRLDKGGWEVGLHGSYDSYGDRTRLLYEKNALENVLGHPITGGRQHYLNLTVPETWRYHRDVGLRYDASLGSSTEYGFRVEPAGEASGNITGENGPYHGVLRPFDDDFLVFPLTVMDAALMDAAPNREAAWRKVRGILREASEKRAVFTVVWHPRLLNREEFPGYRWVYKRLVEEALSMDAWVGPIEDAYREIVRSDCPMHKEGPRQG